jgi:hypothetical protein
MKGEIVDQMTSGIDDAQVVVVFITKNYMEKVGGANGSTDNCKIEFSYAYRHKKPELMIPVVMEKGLHNNALWKGALGAALGGALYLDFSNEDESVHEENCRKLYQEIASRVTPYFSLPLAVEQPRRALGSLSVEEVSYLLKNCNMSKFAPAFIENEVDGRALLHADNIEELTELGVTMKSKAKSLLEQINEFKVKGGVPIDLLVGEPAAANNNKKFVPPAPSCPIHTSSACPPLPSKEDGSCPCLLQ